MEEENYQNHNFEETNSVYLNKVPSTITESAALASLCLKITGIQPIDCFKYQPEQIDNKSASWGILEFSDIRQAENAILQLNNNPIFSFEACLRQKRSSNDQQRAGDGQSKVFDAKSFNHKDSAECNSRNNNDGVLKQIGRGFKLGASGVATSSFGLSHFVGPVYDVCKIGTDNNFDRNTPVDSFGDYVGCYYEPFNSVTRRDIHSERNAAGLAAREKYIEWGHRNEASSSNFSSQSVSVNMSCNGDALGSIATASAEDLLSADGGFKTCLACSRVTSIVCHQCGKPFCSYECVAASEEHVKGLCQGHFTAPLHLKNKFANLKSGISNSLVLGKDDLKSQVQPRSDDSFASPQQDQFNSWVSATKLGSLFSITVRSIVKEYGEPVAFVCTLNPPGAISIEWTTSADQELESMTFLGTLLTTSVPALGIWMESLKMGSSHQVEFVALKGAKITGNMLSEHLHVCKISLELWNPVLEAKIPSSILAAGNEVIISHICSSNFCYVKLSRNFEHHRLLLDINYFFLNNDPCVTWPQIGQLVLALSEIDGQCHRARVKAIISEDKVLILCIDVGNYEVVSQKGLYLLSSYLQQIPAEAVLVKLSNVEECQMSKKSITFMEDLATKGTKLLLDFNSSKEVELKVLETGQSVNSKLNKTLKKSWEMDAPDEILEKRVNDVKLEEWGTATCGKMLPLVILNHSEGEVSCCQMHDPLFNCALRFFPELAEEFVDACFWNKNVPVLNDFVLVQSKKDGLWYRAWVFDCCSNTVDVLFIDFGDSETDVANSRVRKLPFELKNAPVLGMQVTVLGATAESEEVATKMCQMLQPGNIIEGIVFGQPDSSPVLLVPSLLKELVLNGLLSHSEVDSIVKFLNRMSLPEASAVADFVSGLKKAKPRNLLTLCDLNQNIIPSFDIPMCVMQGLDNALAELVQIVLQEELLLKAADGARQYEAGLKINYFRALQKWVRLCEDKKLDSCSNGIEENEAEDVHQVTKIAVPAKPSMLSQLLKSGNATQG